MKARSEYATYDFRDPEQAALFDQQEVERMKRSVAKELRDLEAKGITDMDGRLLRSDARPICFPIPAPMMSSPPPESLASSSPVGGCASAP